MTPTNETTAIGAAVELDGRADVPVSTSVVRRQQAPLICCGGIEVDYLVEPGLEWEDD